MKLIDSHAHLDFSEFHSDFSEVLTRAREAGVEKIINIGADLDRSGAAAQIADSSDNIFATVGVHPDEAGSVNFETIHQDIIDLAKSSPKVVGIGECGLDYYKPRASSLQPPDKIIQDSELRTQEVQRRLFEIHIDIARHLDLPLVIHIRNGEDELAAEEAYEILKKNSYFRGVIHCFTMGQKWAKMFAELGFYIGFTGIITYKNAEEIRDSVAALPLEKILVETDCPFLAPQSHRGKRNEPAYVVEVAEKIAEVKGLPLEKVAERVTMNTEELFGLD